MMAHSNVCVFNLTGDCLTQSQCFCLMFFFSGISEVIELYFMDAGTCFVDPMIYTTDEFLTIVIATPWFPTLITGFEF